MSKRTKIVCTIGPASQKKSVLQKMLQAGMNVARLNFSHGSYADHLKTLRLIRSLSKKLDKPVTILQDLQGPKIRLGELPKEGIVIKDGETITLSTDPNHSPKHIPVQLETLHKEVKKGERIMIADGTMEVKVLSVSGRSITCKVIAGGTLYTHKGMNFPETKLQVSAITPKDIEDAVFGVQQNVDYIALSFVREAQDVKQLRRIVQKAEQGLKVRPIVPTRIIVKIEKGEAIENFDEILKEADGIMVARGDLGVEIDPAKVPVIQKDIIKKCLDAAKPVIVATQMLDSMIHTPRPTRAEVSDVANAVIDHTDAVMLSGESAAGKYPVESVQMMASIIRETENSHYDDIDLSTAFKEVLSEQLAISSSAAQLAKTYRAKAILVASLSGFTARNISRYRPELPILVATDNEKVRRQTNLNWGVEAFVMPRAKNVEELVKKSIAKIKREKFVRKGDMVIVIAGQPRGKSGAINWIEMHQV